MPQVTIEISYAEEEFGRGEISTFTRQVEDLDVEDWAWYLLKASEVAGYLIKDVHLVTEEGKFYSTEE